MSSPPKYNYLKQMTTAAIERSPQRRQQKNYANHRTIYPTDGQQRALGQLFEQEMVFYNNFVHLMQARLKSDPDFYMNVGERHRQLFVVMAQLGFDIRTLVNRKSKNNELPPLMEPYRDILFGISTTDGEKGMPENLVIFYEVCRHKANVLIDTRKNMASAFIDFYTAQSRSNNNKYILEEVNNMQKRHIQIAKSQVTLKVVNTKTEFGSELHTEIKIPHLKTPLIMRADINELQQWNMLILHKDPSELDLGNTVLDWEADFRQTDDQYLLKYLETPNPISKMESRFIKR